MASSKSSASSSNIAKNADKKSLLPLKIVKKSL